jgi:hypothetical protein
LNTQTQITGGPLITDSSAGNYTLTVTANPSSALGSLLTINDGESYTYNTTISSGLLGNHAFDQTGTRFVKGFYTDGSTGYVQVWLRIGSSWSIETTINLGSNNLHFGRCVSINAAGDKIAVINDWYTSGFNYSGRIHIYSRAGSTWTAGQIITGPTNFNLRATNVSDNQVNDNMTMSSDGLMLAVAATDNTNSGSPTNSLLIYTSSGGSFSLVQNIANIRDAVNAAVSVGSISISTDLTKIAAGIPNARAGASTGTTYGAVFVYTGSPGSYTLQTSLYGNTHLGYFGSQVYLNNDGSILAASGQKFSDPYTSLGRIYTRSGSTWSLARILTHSPFTLLKGGALFMDSAAQIAVFGNTIYRRNSVDNTWAITNEISLSSGLYSSTIPEIVPRANCGSSDGTYISLGTVLSTSTNQNIYKRDIQSNYDSGTKTLTVIAPKINLNILVDHIYYTPATGYSSNFDFVYTYTLPNGNQSIRSQNINKT